jgi:iron-sulfur cluster assembly accessory protein
MENTGESASLVTAAEAQFQPTEERPIFITEAAVKAIKTTIESSGNAGSGLRVSVRGGGCSGYEYNLDFEEEERDDDVVMDFDGVKIYLDSVSADLLRGTKVDYLSSLQEQGFKFINPNAKRTCGCGNSFS